MRNGDLITLVKDLTVKGPGITTTYKFNKGAGVVFLCLGTAPAAGLPREQAHAMLDAAVAAYKAAHPLPTAG